MNIVELTGIVLVIVAIVLFMIYLIFSAEYRKIVKKVLDDYSLTNK